MSEKTKLHRLLNNTQNFTVTRYFTKPDHSGVIAVDENRGKVFIGSAHGNSEIITHDVISAKDILGVEISKNGQVFSNTNTLGMAAIGGLLFGGAGAVVGAITGLDSNSNTNSTEVALKIAVDNIQKPYICFIFLEASPNQNTDEVPNALQNAEKWYGIISILLNRECNDPKVKQLNITVEKDETNSLIGSLEENGTEEEIIHIQAYDEFESKAVDKAVMAKAIIAAEGDPGKERSFYLKLRVEQLNRQHQQRIKKDIQSIIINKKQSLKESKSDLDDNLSTDLFTNINHLWTGFNTGNKELISKYLFNYSSVLTSQDKFNFSSEFDLSTKIWSAQHQIIFSTALLYIIHKVGISKFQFTPQAQNNLMKIIEIIPPACNIKLPENIVGILRKTLISKGVLLRGKRGE